MIAAAAGRSGFHDISVRILEFLESHPGPLVVPELVVTKVAYLLAGRLGV